MKARAPWIGGSRRCKINDLNSRLMITGVHAIIYTKQADHVRAFFRETLGRPSVDAGHGWLIFALPPAELGIHPSGADESHELYLLCDDVEATVRELAAKGVSAGPIRDQGWGRVTSLTIADGVQLGLYEPRHPTAIGVTS